MRSREGICGGVDDYVGSKAEEEQQEQIRQDAGEMQIHVPNPGDFQPRALFSPGCLEGLIDVAGALLT